MKLRKVFFDVDIEQTKITNNINPFVFVDEQVVFCISFFNGDGTNVRLTAQDRFDLSINDKYNDYENLIIYSGNELVNVPGDWEHSNLNEGRISIRVFCNSTKLYTLINKSEQFNALLEIKKFTNGLFSVLLQGTVTCKNIVNNLRGAQPLELRGVYTRLESDSKFISILQPEFPNFIPVEIIAGNLTIDQVSCEIISETNVEINTIEYDKNLVYLYHDSDSIITLKNGTGNISIGNDLILERNKVYRLYFIKSMWRI